MPVMSRVERVTEWLKCTLGGGGPSVAGRSASSQQLLPGPMGYSLQPLLSIPTQLPLGK